MKTANAKPARACRPRRLEMDTDFEAMTPAGLQSAYDALAAEYERKVWFDQAVLGVGRLRRRLMSRARGRILDVACGTGLNFAHFPRGSRVTGVDLSPEMLGLARRTAERLGLQADLLVMDAQGLDFPDESFDTVVSSLSTCTFPDPIAALREMGRVCRSDGSILLLEHGHSSLPWLAKFQDRTVHQHYQQNAGCRWNQEPLELVRAAGLRVLQDRRSIFGMFHSMEARPGGGS
jgi:ubiquinone/menaquinone biosynthesis C-methylase UbiE